MGSSKFPLSGPSPCPGGTFLRKSLLDIGKSQYARDQVSLSFRGGLLFDRLAPLLCSVATGGYRGQRFYTLAKVCPLTPQNRAIELCPGSQDSKIVQATGR